MVSWSTQPIRFEGGYTVALAPQFQGPRPKDRGSVGSALVCRWPPGGMSGALRPPQSPQDSEETSHRKVKQRGREGKSLRTLPGGAGALLATKPTHSPPLFPFWGFP